MKVRVLYSDMSRGLVEDSNLDDLASRGLIVAYSRPGSEEWVEARNKHLLQNAINTLEDKTYWVQKRKHLLDVDNRLVVWRKSCYRNVAGMWFEEAI